MDQYNEMHSVSRRLIEIAADSIQLTGSLDTELVKLQNLVIGQNQLQKESQELVLRTRMVPTKTIISRLRRGIRQACRVTGKQVELNVEDNDTYMDSEVLNDLIEPLMHVLRNAVDHGIEASDVRSRLGKPETGYVQLSFARMGDQIVINVEDDGQGLNLDMIKAKAINNGLIKADMDINDEAICRLILEAGLSTRNEVTQVSGRGIGLDVVNVKIRELKGSINIYSNHGVGCRFELVLPISSFSTHSLLVRVRENIYAISNRGIEEILYPGLGELCEVGDETIFKLEDQAFGAILVDDLLDFNEDRRQIDRSNRPILLVREESGAKTAILVQEVIDSRDVVVKSMGHYLPKLHGIIGATVLGDGSVAPVMDLPEMLQHRSAHRHHVSKGRQHADVKVSRLPYVLVVDDSLSARRSLAQFVQDMGMDVRTARDGMEAVSLIEARPPDLMLVDMEMPRMNGLELTSHVRASSNTNTMPVIMITSRSTDKHRAAAMEKGVNHFMVKPFIEEELAQYINDALDIAS
jgi:chemosensory pili system protein ChpA (sensor histidine kinase/response regulator)